MNFIAIFQFAHILPVNLQKLLNEAISHFQNDLLISSLILQVASICLSCSRRSRAIFYSLTVEASANTLFHKLVEIGEKWWQLCNILILCPLFALFQYNIHSIFRFLWRVLVLFQQSFD